MLAIVATPDGPSWTERREVAPPAPAPNEALVAVRAFAVNRGELTLVRRRDGWQPGQDVAGEGVHPAAEGTGPEGGERGAGPAEWHGWAEQTVVPSPRLPTIPPDVDFERAAALPMAGTTAANLVRGGGPLLGARVLITGASGGVGHLAVQLPAPGGAPLRAVARAERADALRGFGAHEVVADPSETEGPFELVLESAGGASLDAAPARVAPGGTVLLFGNSSREPSTIDFTAFFGHEEATVRSYFSARHEADAGRLLAMLLDLLAAGRLEVEIGFRASWDRVNEAMDGLSERRFAGKAVLTVD